MGAISFDLVYIIYLSRVFAILEPKVFDMKLGLTKVHCEQIKYRIMTVVEFTAL